MANTPEMVQIALKLKPAIICIVPESREEVTTEGGLDVAANLAALIETRKKMNDAGIKVSLFINPTEDQIQASAQCEVQFIELHTGAYAEHFHSKRERNVELERLISASNLAHELGLQVNAGHGLNYENLPVLHTVPHMVELNIGHSIISRAVMTGLESAVKEMMKLLENYAG